MTRCWQELARHDGATTLALRRRLAGLAYARTAAYDAAIAGWFAAERGETFPAQLTLAAGLKERLRYGENPHQQAAFYVGGEHRPGVASAKQLQGKELSFNNLNDTDAAIECVAEFAEPAVAIIKHANPCGVACGPSLGEAYAKALACDPVSAYGGIIAVNRPLDAATAEAIAKRFAEVVIAPAIEPAAQAALARRTALRLLVTGGMPDPAAPGMTLRSLAGGYLLQTRDNGRIGAADLKVVTRRPPSDAELADLLFAFRVAKHVKSNAIVYAKARRHGRHRRRSDEPRRQRAHRRLEGGGGRQGRRPGREPGEGLGGGFRRFLSLRRRARGRHRRRRHRRHPARRLGARPGGDRRRRPGRHRHGLHRHAAFPALTPRPFRPDPGWRSPAQGLPSAGRHCVSGLSRALI